jgi:uncharacterized membrane protein
MNRWLLCNILLTVAAFAASFYLGAVRPDLLPEKVPIHWDAAGKADGLVAREHVLSIFLIIPGVMAGVVLLSLVLPWLSPRQFSIDRFRATYNFLMGLVGFLFAYIHGITLVASAQLPIDMTKAMLGGLFLFLALIGNLLGKVQRNFFIGIRTPWTLADETVWIRTHRVGAWVVTVGSLMGLVAVLCGAPFWWAFGGFMVMALFPVVYSLVLYKRLEKQGKLSSVAVSSSMSPEGPA